MLPLKQDEEELLHLRPKEVGRWRLGLPAASFGLAVLGLLGLGSWTRQTAERSIDWEEISSDWEEIPGIDEIIHRAEGLPVWATKKVPRELSDLFYGSNPSEIPWARTECVIDVVQATSYLGQGVVFLYRAIKYDGWQCPDNSNVGCAISVSGFIASMFWLASYLSLASSACADSLNSNGLCGADWLALTADFAEVANAGAGIQEDCDFGKDWITLLNVTGDVPGWEAFVPAGLPPTEQAIKKIEHLRQAQRNRDFDITMCVFDSTNAASFLVRAILQIRRASIACSNPRNCAIDILDVISSFGWISRFVSMAVSDCMVRGSQKALCAADLSNLVAALSNGPASGMATVSDCAELQNPATELMHEPTA